MVNGSTCSECPQVWATMNPICMFATTKQSQPSAAPQRHSRQNLNHESSIRLLVLFLGVITSMSQSQPITTILFFLPVLLICFCRWSRGCLQCFCSRAAGATAQPPGKRCVGSLFLWLAGFRGGLDLPK